jgi:hypothetical protein
LQHADAALKRGANAPHEPWRAARQARLANAIRRTWCWRWRFSPPHQLWDFADVSDVTTIDAMRNHNLCAGRMMNHPRCCRCCGGGLMRFIVAAHPNGIVVVDDKGRREQGLIVPPFQLPHPLMSHSEVGEDGHGEHATMDGLRARGCGQLYLAAPNARMVDRALHKTCQQVNKAHAQR